jgi:hypothetical protein
LAGGCFGDASFGYEHGGEADHKGRVGHFVLL